MRVVIFLSSLGNLDVELFDSSFNAEGLHKHAESPSSRRWQIVLTSFDPFDEFGDVGCPATTKPYSAR